MNLVGWFLILCTLVNMGRSSFDGHVWMMQWRPTRICVRGGVVVGVSERGEPSVHLLVVFGCEKGWWQGWTAVWSGRGERTR
jgi:hypothetical protein